MTKRLCIALVFALVTIACGGGRAVTEKRTLDWGNRFLYRRLRVDKYNIISSGADGQFGNEDDVILENGVLYEPSKIYAESPLE